MMNSSTLGTDDHRQVHASQSYIYQGDAQLPSPQQTTKSIVNEGGSEQSGVQSEEQAIDDPWSPSIPDHDTPRLKLLSDEGGPALWSANPAAD